jgi:hypothetical protein
MERYSDNDEFRDPFLEKMVLKMPVPKTSSNFTKEVMEQLYAQVEPQIEPETYRKQMLWAYLSIGVGIAVIAVILFAIWPFFEVNLKLDSSRILSFINTSLAMVDSITNFASYLKESVVMISILFSILVLLTVERLLNSRRVNDSSSYNI